MNKRAKENYGSIRITDANSVQRAIDELNRRVQALSVKQQAVGTEASDQRTQPIGSIQVADEWNETSSQYESVIRVRGKRGWVTIGNTPGSVIASDVGSTAVGSITATNVQDAIAELEAEINALGGTPAASAVSYDNTTSTLSPGSNVQEAIDTLDGLVDTNTTNIGTNTTNIGTNDTEIANLYTLLNRTTSDVNFGTFTGNAANVITANQTLRPILQEIGDQVRVNEVALVDKLEAADIAGLLSSVAAESARISGDGTIGTPLDLTLLGITGGYIADDTITGVKIKTSAFGSSATINYDGYSSNHQFSIDGPGSTLSGILVGLDDVPSWLTDTKANLANKSIRMNSGGTAWEWYTPSAAGMTNWVISDSNGTPNTATIGNGEDVQFKGGDASGNTSSPKFGIKVAVQDDAPDATVLIENLYTMPSSRDTDIEYAASGKAVDADSWIRFGNNNRNQGVIGAYQETGITDSPIVLELAALSTDTGGRRDGRIKLTAPTTHIHARRLSFGVENDSATELTTANYRNDLGPDESGASVLYQSYFEQRHTANSRYRRYLVEAEATAATDDAGAVEFTCGGQLMSNISMFRTGPDDSHAWFTFVRVVGVIAGKAESGDGGDYHHGYFNFFSVLEKDDVNALQNRYGINLSTAISPNDKSWDATMVHPHVISSLSGDKWTLKLCAYDSDGAGDGYGTGTGTNEYYCTLMIEVFDGLGHGAVSS